MTTGKTYEHAITRPLDAKVLTLTVANMINQIIPKAFLTFSSFFASKFNVSDSQIAWLVNAFTISYIINMFISAQTTTYMNNTRIRQCIIASLFFIATLFGIQSINVIHRSFITTVLINFVAALLQSMTFIYFTSVLAALSVGGAMGPSLSIFNSAWGWVTFLSPAIGSILYRETLSNFFLYFSFIFSIPIAAACFLFPDETMNEVLTLTNESETNIDREWTSTRVYHLVVSLTMTIKFPILLTSCFFAGLVCFAFFFSLARFLRGQYGFNPEQAGMVFVVIGVSEIVGAFIAAWTTRAPPAQPSGREGEDSTEHDPLISREGFVRGANIRSTLAPTTLVLCGAFLLMGIPNFLIFLAQVIGGIFGEIMLSLPCTLAYIFFFTLGWEIFFTNILVLFLDMGAMTKDSQSILVSSYFLLNGAGKMTGVFLSPLLYNWNQFGAVAGLVFILSFSGCGFMAFWASVLPDEITVE